MTANYILTPKSVKRGTQVHSSLLDAYSAAQSGDQLLLKALEYNEAFVANRGVDLIISGGYDTTFASNSGAFSIISRPLIIKSGSLTLNKLVIGTSATKVVVPDVVNKSQSDAIAAIQYNDLATGSTSQAASVSLPPGAVISQNPVAGSAVPRGTAVNLTVSTGPTSVAVPDLADMSQDGAGGVLTNNYLTVGSVTMANSDTVSAGNVISQTPLSGTVVIPGTAVNLVLSTGSLEKAAVEALNADLPTLRTNIAVYMANAAAEFGVPLPILQAIAYQQSHWTHLYPEQAITDNSQQLVFGPMGLTTEAGSGPQLSNGATLIGQTDAVVRSDTNQNIRAGAAILKNIADDLRSSGVIIDATLESWVEVIKRFDDVSNPIVKKIFMYYVYKIVYEGVNEPDIAIVPNPGLNQNLIFPPAAAIQATAKAVLATAASSGFRTLMSLLTSWDWGVQSKTLTSATHGSVTVYDFSMFTASRRFQVANRVIGDINKIVLHKPQSSGSGAVQEFMNSNRSGSSHYVIDSDGYIYQTVQDKDIAYGAQTEYDKALEIELDGWADKHFETISPALLKSLISLLNILAENYQLGQLHQLNLIGHNQATKEFRWGPSDDCKKRDPITNKCTLKITSGYHYDPGAWFNWDQVRSGVGSTYTNQVLTVISPTCNVYASADFNKNAVMSKVYNGQKFVVNGEHPIVPQMAHSIYMAGAEQNNKNIFKGEAANVTHEAHWDGWLRWTDCSYSVDHDLSTAIKIDSTNYTNAADRFPNMLPIYSDPATVNATPPVNILPYLLGFTIEGKQFVTTGNSKTGWDGDNYVEIYLPHWNDPSRTKGWVKYPAQLLPKTGQTVSYGPRDDGALQMGKAWPVPRFVDNGDGSVTDKLTNLIWFKDANSKITSGGINKAKDCATSPTYCGYLTWNDAVTWVAGLGNGWRLPTRSELFSLIDFSQYGPSLPPGYATYFNNVQSSYYWSSSSYAGSTGYAWYVGMYVGVVYYFSKGYYSYVWPVRSGQ